MPKLKVKKAAKKRYKPVGNKKFLRHKAFKGHILEKKSAKRKRSLSKAIFVKKSDIRPILKMLGC